MGEVLFLTVRKQGHVDEMDLTHSVSPLTVIAGPYAVEVKALFVTRLEGSIVYCWSRYVVAKLEVPVLEVRVMLGNCRVLFASCLSVTRVTTNTKTSEYHTTAATSTFTWHFPQGSSALSGPFIPPFVAGRASGTIATGQCYLSSNRSRCYHFTILRCGEDLC